MNRTLRSVFSRKLGSSKMSHTWTRSIINNQHLCSLVRFVFSLNPHCIETFYGNVHTTGLNAQFRLLAEIRLLFCVVVNIIIQMGLSSISIENSLWLWSECMHRRRRDVTHSTLYLRMLPIFRYVSHVGPRMKVTWVGFEKIWFLLLRLSRKKSELGNIWAKRSDLGHFWLQCEFSLNVGSDIHTKSQFLEPGISIALQGWHFMETLFFDGLKRLWFNLSDFDVLLFWRNI